MKPLERILHVEDVPSIQVVTRIALERIGGFQVLSCASGEDALARGPAFAPDLILLDVMLPDMDGPETMHRLRELPALAAVPVVFLTGNIDHQRLATLLNLGACDVLSKPFDPLQLSERLRMIWTRMHE